MKIQKAFKFKLMPNGSQAKQFAQFAGCRRVVFNKGLELQNTNYKEGNKFIPYSKLTGNLVAWKKELIWLSDCHSQVLQQSLKDLEVAFKRFFRKESAYPAFKKKGLNDSFRFPQIKSEAINEANSRIKLPKLGWVKYKKSRSIQGTPKNITISRKLDSWYVSIQVEYDVDRPLPKAKKAIGLDLGVARFATLSDGSYIEPLNAFKNSQAKLAKYQRQMARKKKFSNNWTKAKAKVSKLQNKIANSRRDFLHKASTAICNNHALVAIEDLKVSNMSKSAKGSFEEPGKNVKAKSGLNRSILDQGWNEFRRQLEYKMSWSGGEVVAVAPHYTSQACPCCGHVHKENRKTQAKFECVSCGFEENADFVGALNILNKAHEVLAAGRAVKPSGAGALAPAVKQEPTEEILVA